MILSALVILEHSNSKITQETSTKAITCLKMRPELTFTPEYHDLETKEVSVDHRQKIIDCHSARNS